MGTYPSALNKNNTWPIPMSCEVCGRVPDALRLCDQCHMAHYCSPEHQAFAWEHGHREACLPQARATQHFVTTIRKAFDRDPATVQREHVEDLIQQCGEQKQTLIEAAERIAAIFDAGGATRQAAAVRLYTKRCSERTQRVAGRFKNGGDVGPVFTGEDTFGERKKLMDALMPYVESGMDGVEAYADLLELEDALLERTPDPDADPAERLLLRIMTDQLLQLLDTTDALAKASSDAAAQTRSPTSSVTVEELKMPLPSRLGVYVEAVAVDPQIQHRLDEMAPHVFVERFIPRIHASTSHPIRIMLLRITSIFIDPVANFNYWAFRKLFPILITRYASKQELLALYPRLQPITPDDLNNPNDPNQNLARQKSHENMELLMETFPKTRQALVSFLEFMGMTATFVAAAAQYELLDRPAMVRDIRDYEELYPQIVGNQTSFEETNRTLANIEEFEQHRVRIFTASCEGEMGCLVEKLQNPSLYPRTAASLWPVSYPTGSRIIEYVGNVSMPIAARVSFQNALSDDAQRLGNNIARLNGRLEERFDPDMRRNLAAGNYALATQFAVASDVSPFLFANTSYAGATAVRLHERVDRILGDRYGTGMSDWSPGHQALYYASYLLTPYGQYREAYQAIVGATALRTQIPGQHVYNPEQLRSMNRAEYREYISRHVGTVGQLNREQLSLLHNDMVANFNVDYWTAYVRFLDATLFRNSAFMGVGILFQTTQLAATSWHQRLTRTLGEESIIPYLWYTRIEPESIGPATPARATRLDALGIIRYYKNWTSGNAIYDWRRWAQSDLYNPARSLYFVATLVRGIQHVFSVNWASGISASVYELYSITRSMLSIRGFSRILLPLMPTPAEGGLNLTWGARFLGLFTGTTGIRGAQGRSLTAPPDIMDQLLVYDDVASLVNNSNSLVGPLVVLANLMPVLGVPITLLRKMLKGTASAAKSAVVAGQKLLDSMPTVDENADLPTEAQLALLTPIEQEAREASVQWSNRFSALISLVSFIIIMTNLFNLYETSPGAIVYGNKLQQRLRILALENEDDDTK